MIENLFRFTGMDGSLGYKHGRIYCLQIVGRGAFTAIKIEAPIPCPYDSWEKFFENWERV